jgi:hypothetical protein
VWEVSSFDRREVSSFQAASTAAFNAVKSEIPGWLVAIAFLFMLASEPRKKPRRRRAAW